MIDLSITKDPEWIKTREEVWKPIGDSLKEGLRKKEMEKIYHYFMTGILRDGEELSDGAKFYWFPIQTTAAWDHIFENMFDSNKAEKEFETIFYFQLGDLTGRALTAEQELAMWDYFAGDVFQPIVTSRVPVGKAGGKVTFNVDNGNIAAEFANFMDRWICGSCGDDPKWKKRINYFLSFLKKLPESSFIKREDGKPSTREGRCIRMVFNSVCKPIISGELGLAGENFLSVREKFVEELYETFEMMEMSPAMREIWKDAKAH